MSEANLKKLGKKIKAARNETGLTQKDVAERAGTSTNHYAQIEQGRANPSFLLLTKIAKVLGIKSSDIFRL